VAYSFARIGAAVGMKVEDVFVQNRRLWVRLREKGGKAHAVPWMGVSLSTVNRAHMAYDHGGIKALKPKPNGGRKRENMTISEEKAAAGALCQGRRGRRDVEHPRFQAGLRAGDRPSNQQQHGL
jgi:integrase